MVDEKTKLLENVLADMDSYLSEEQLQILKTCIVTNLYRVSITPAKNEVVSSSVDTNARYLKLFVASRRLEGMSDKTLRQYVLQARNLLLFLNKDFRDVTTNDVQYYLSEYERTHNVCRRSIENMRKAINGWFLWLEENDYIAVNPVKKIHPIAFEKKRIETLSVEEVYELRELIHDDIRTRAIVELLLATGVRVSELCSLNISDVDFNTCEVVVHCAKKRNKEDRTVFLTADAKLTLQKYLKYREERGYTDNPALFMSNKKGGKRITERLVNTKLRELEEKLNINKKITVHIFRKTLASRLHSMGFPSLSIAYILGHADTRMSETYYISVKKDMIKTDYAKLFYS